VSVPPGERRYLPGLHPIDAYGRGGFRFAGLSHRGSLLCLPSGMSAWPIASAREIGEAALEPVFVEAAFIDLFIIGAGSEPWPLPEPLRRRFRGLPLNHEVMTTGAAVRTYNVLLAEGRRIAAALIAVE
jgi:uncharacterized protein